MKKYLSILAVTAMAASAMAQGTINFANNSASLVKTWTSPSDSTLVNLAVGGGRVQLGWAAVGAAYTPWTPSMSPTAWLAANPGWTLLTPTANIAPVAGRFSGGTLTAATPPGGGPVQAVVVGWTGSYATFEEAYAAGTAMVGVSSPFSVTTGDPNATPIPGTPGSITPGFTGVTLQPVPEPSTFALAGLGAAALLIFRRRS